MHVIHCMKTVRRIATATLLGLMPYGAVCQSPAPAFEVASVKQNRSGSGSSSSGFTRHPGGGYVGFAATNSSLQKCIKWAYGVEAYQISGPAWLDEDRYDVVAKASSSVSGKQIALMLRALLEERFNLKLHIETKQLAVYALVVGRNGPKLREVKAGPGHITEGRGLLSGQKTTMSQLAETLSRVMDRPVLNKTELRVSFDFTLKWTADDSQPVPRPGEGQLPNSGTSRPSIFTAMQQQLGLKLEARKSGVDVLVVDQAQKVPTEN